jgi:hypothetical protein
MRPTCPTHPHIHLVTFCPACRGQAGGRSTSPKKVRAVKKNARKGAAKKKQARRAAKLDALDW